MDPRDRTVGIAVGDLVRWSFRPEDLWVVEEVHPPYLLTVTLSWGEAGVERHVVEAEKCRVVPA